MKLNRLINKIKHSNGTHHCSACKSKILRFTTLSENFINDLKKIKTAPDGFETLNIESYFCPLCGANDRDRLILSYIFQKHKKDRSILEIAPSTAIRKKLKEENFSYRCCDLFMPDVDDVCDISKMDCYDNNSFDIVICSHVLEHVHKDADAIAEIFRVLKPGGEAILLVPIPIGTLETLYDPEIQAPELRVINYGQNDHVRMYSKDGFLDLIKTAGFKPNVWTMSDSNENFDKIGLTNTSTLYIGIKPK